MRFKNILCLLLLDFYSIIKEINDSSWVCTYFNKSRMNFDILRCLLYWRFKMKTPVCIILSWWFKLFYPKIQKIHCNHVYSHVSPNFHKKSTNLFHIYVRTPQIEIIFMHCKFPKELSNFYPIFTRFCPEFF